MSKCAELIEWGIRYSDGKSVNRMASEEEARADAEARNAIDDQPFDMIVVRRTVTEWQESPTGPLRQN